MNTPICDFVRSYAQSSPLRLHMPGHKGRTGLGPEELDITEVEGADVLYHARGIIRASEKNASRLFGSAATFYSAEGSSLCIRAMLFLARLHAGEEGRSPLILAGRNAHKTFLSAAALLDLEVEWLCPEGGSLLSCPIMAEDLEKVFAGERRPTAVYVTSPDYLGNLLDLKALAEVCHKNGALLLVDNAHGAYLHFLSPPCHPLDLGADLCCDSAHKTLPVLTGGAYLHLAKSAPAELASSARGALALFGSTSPSYLTLASLDLCNAYLAEDYPARLAAFTAELEALRARLRENGWAACPSDPLRLTLDAAASGLTGTDLADLLRQGGVECEYADGEYTVLMATPENAAEDLERVLRALGRNHRPPLPRSSLPPARVERVVSVRQAVFAPRETVPAAESLGRICGAPAVSCPPAIPIAVSGERIGPEAVELFRYCGVETVDVVREEALTAWSLGSPG